MKKKYEDYEIICPLPFGLYNLKEKLKDKLFKEYKYTFDFLNSKQNSYKNYAKFNRMIEKYMENYFLKEIDTKVKYYCFNYQQNGV